MNAVWASAIVAALAFIAGVAYGAVRARRHRVVAARHAARAASAEDRARTTERELRSRAVALDTMQEGVVLFGTDGRATYANGASRRHLGEVTVMDDLLPAEIRGVARHTALAHLEASAEARASDGVRWLEATATPVGEDDSVLLVVRDVTEAHQIDAIRRDFVANASHELKTPVASIRAVAETLADAASGDTDAVARFAPTLEREAERLSRIVSDLLDLSRLEGGSALEEDVAIDALIQEDEERFADAARRVGVALDLALDGGVRVRGSRRDLALLVRNLVDNAIRYTKPGGRVEVAVRLDDEEVVLLVADTGIGIPSGDIGRLFERFYRVDRARSRETGGTGLGLAIVRHVVENHRGTIDVDSELGRGSRFEVRLPTAPGV